MNTSKEVKLANTNRQAAIKERKTKITASNLIRWAGLSAMVAGIIFAVIQPIHPPDVLASVNTRLWAIITSFKTVSYTHLRAHETVLDLVCRLLLEHKKNTHKHTHTHTKKKKQNNSNTVTSAT